MKRILLVLLACAAVAAFTLRPAEAEPSLGIGSKAPSLDIEHYVQDGNGAFGPVTNFEKGKVYVVEFWATWCPPCKQSMPHLAELQTKYRDQDVRIIGVSDETLDEVQALMQTQIPELKKSYGEVTSAYTLTTDPDGSVYRDYMLASGNEMVPTSFIVGKTGLIEWIGSPFTMDAPLEAVLDGSWDRDEFKELLELENRFQEDVEEFAQLAGRGKLDEAGKMLEERLAAATNEDIKARWISVRHRFRVMTGQSDESDFDFYRAELESTKGSVAAIVNFARMIYSTAQEGGDIGPLAKETAVALTNEVENAEPEMKPLLFNTIAQMHIVDDDLDKAIEASEAAVEVAEGRQKKRLVLILDELKSVRAKQSDALDLDDETAAKDK